MLEYQYKAIESLSEKDKKIALAQIGAGGVIWYSEEEDWLIKEGYPDPLVTKEDLMEMLPLRNWKAIICRASKLGVQWVGFQANKKWTEEEKKFVTENFKRGNVQWIADQLGRTKKSVLHMGDRLGIKCRPYMSPKEVEYIIDNFDPINPKESAETIAKYFNSIGHKTRTAASISSKASELGLKIQQVTYTDEDIKILKKYYPTEGTDIIKRLPKFSSRGGITNKAMELGLVVDVDKKRQLYWEKELEGTEYRLLEPAPPKGKKTLVKHITCGHEWKVLLPGLKSYAGCPNCSKGNWHRKIFYLIFFPELNLYKIGICMKLDKRRGQYNYDSEVIQSIAFSTPEECAEYERDLKEKLKPYMYDSGLLYSGNTETFMWPD